MIHHDVIPLEGNKALMISDTAPIRVYERKRRKGNRVVHANDETSQISCPGIADVDK